MNVDDAAYRMVHSYPGGSEALAPRMGMTAAVLRNKVNPHNPSHKLALEEANLGMGLTGDFSVLEAMAAEHGFVLRRAGQEGAAASLMQVMLQSQATRGAVWTVVQQALVDNLITPNEYAAIDAALMAATTADRELLDALRAQVPKAPDGQG